MDIRDHPDDIPAGLGAIARIETQPQEILLTKLFCDAFRDHNILDLRRGVEREVCAESASLQWPDAQRLEIVEVNSYHASIDNLVLVIKPNAKIAQSPILSDAD